jgi:hypothetical protein
MAQASECLPSKCEALNSNPSFIKKKKKERKKRLLHSIPSPPKMERLLKVKVKHFCKGRLEISLLFHFFFSPSFIQQTSAHNLLYVHL